MGGREGTRHASRADLARRCRGVRALFAAGPPRPPGLPPRAPPRGGAEVAGDPAIFRARNNKRCIANSTAVRNARCGAQHELPNACLILLRKTQDERRKTKEPGRQPGNLSHISDEPSSRVPRLASRVLRLAGGAEPSKRSRVYQAKGPARIFPPSWSTLAPRVSPPLPRGVFFRFRQADAAGALPSLLAAARVSAPRG